MKRILCLLLSVLIIITSCYPVFADDTEDNPANNTVSENSAVNEFLFDDCAAFDKSVSHSEGLALDVVTEENKYAFSGDDTHIIRVTSDAEWLIYEVNSNGYFVFNTCFSPSEPVSNFTFQYSDDKESWIDFNPIITQKSVESYKWISVSYSLKKLPESARYIKITFQNIGGTPWSPCIESVELRPYTTSEQGFVDCIGTKYYKPTSKLKNLGLVSGYSNTEFKPSDTVTRAEFCTMTAKLLGINALLSPDSYEKVFDDIESDYWGAGAIYAMYGLGVINGDENKNFNPEDNIILQDAVKIIVSILGYNAIADSDGGYPAGFVTTANRLRLLSELEEISLADRLTRGDAAILMNNALDVEIMHQTVYGAQNTYSTDGATVLTQYHNIYEKTGIVTDVGYSSVYSEQSAAPDEIIINNERIKSGDMQLLDYLGMKVTAYVRENSDKTHTVVYIENDDINRVTEISYNSYERLEDNSLYYTDENSREQRVSINNNTKIIYNYKYDTRVALIDELDFKAGFLKVISNGTSGSSADYIMVYDYDTYFLADTARLGGTFTDKYIGAVNLGLDNADLILLKNDGEASDYNDDYTVNKDSVLCVVKSKDGQIADVRVSIDTAYGSVKSVNSSEGEYTIGDNIYRISEYFKNTCREIEPRDKPITAYLDINGNIVSFSESGYSEEYGYLQAVSDGGTFNSDVLLRIVTETGKSIEIKADGKSSLNGNSASLKSFLNLTPQLVRFTQRSDGTVASLDTATDLYGEINEDIFARNYRGTNSKYYGDGLNIFASKYQLTGETKVFVVPNDKDEIAKYEVTNLTRLLSDTAYDVELYDLDESYRAGAAVIRLATDDGLIYNYSPIGVILNSGTSIDENGDKFLSIMLYTGGVLSELKFPADGATDRTDNWVPGYVNRNTSNGNNPFSAGEVIQFSVKDDKCSAFRTLLTAEQMNSNAFYEKNLGDYGALSEELFYSEMYSCFGTVERKFSDKIFVCGSDNGWVRSVPLSSQNVYVYDKKTKKLTVGDNTDVEQNGAVFVQLRFSAAAVILVVRD